MNLCESCRHYRPGYRSEVQRYLIDRGGWALVPRGTCANPKGYHKETKADWTCSEHQMNGGQG